MVGLSVIRHTSILSNNFSAEITGLIVTKFHIQPPGPLGRKSCSDGLGHMYNMASTPINVKKKEK